MTKFRYLLGLALACAGLALMGAASGEEKKPKWTGSIRVEGKHTQAELKQMAKITADQAVKAALEAVRGRAGEKKVTETELEVEHGFLVYGVELRINGQRGELEVIVDAGTGKVLAQELEDEDDDEDDDD